MIRLIGLLGQKITKLLTAIYILKPIVDTAIKAVTSLQSISIFAAVFVQTITREALSPSISLKDIYLATYAELKNTEKDNTMIASSQQLMDIYIGVLVRLYANANDGSISATQNIMDVWIDGSKVKRRDNIEPHKIISEITATDILLGDRDSYI